MYKREVLETVQPKDPYNDGRKAYWPAEPTGPVDFVVVGDAPSRKTAPEDLLKKTLDRAGVKGVYFTTTSLYRTDLQGKREPRPTKAIWSKELARLYLEIAMLQPKAILAAGSHAAEVLLGNVFRSRGVVRDCEFLGMKVPVYVTFDPAATLYPPKAGGIGGPDFYYDLVQDVERMRDGVRPLPPLAGCTLEFPVEPVDLWGQVTVDVETDSKHPSLAKLLVVSVKEEDTKTVYIFTPETFETLRDSVGYSAGRVEYLGQNSMFDEIALNKHGIEIHFKHDSLLLHLSQDERRGTHKLKQMAPTLGGVDTAIDRIWKYSHVEDPEEEKVPWDKIPMEDLSYYCGGDSVATEAVFAGLKKTEDKRTADLYKFLMRAHRAFTAGVRHGVMVDRDRLLTELAKQEEKVLALREPIPFDPESHDETIAGLRAAGYDVDSSREEVLEKLDGDLPKNLKAFRTENKTLTAFLRPLGEWTKVDPYVHPTYKIHGTDSGRTSCADPNLQQIPKDLRSLFIASPGNVFVGWDQTAHEVRGIAYYSKDKILCKLLHEGLDPHQYVADLMKTDRATGKTTVFASVYGAGIKKLMVVTGKSAEEVKRLLKEIDSIFPGLKPWKQSVMAQVYEPGYVETPYGRRRNFWLVTEDNAHKQERVAVNFVVQSLCGDIALDGAIQAYERLGLPPLLFVHDSNVVEVPEREEPEIRRTLGEILSNLFPNEVVDFKVDMWSGRTWK